MTDWLNEVRARADAATEGTWCSEYDGDGTYSITADVRLIPGKGFTFGPSICTLANTADDKQAYANADFIARARTDIPRLLSLTDQLQAEVAELHAKLRVRERQLRRLDPELTRLREEVRELTRAFGLNEAPEVAA